MKRVLVVGWCLPSKLKDGASLFIRDLARFYQAQGNHVEIFTIARPEKAAFLGRVSPWKIYTRMARGVRHHVLIRPWGILYTDPLDPLSTVHEPRTTKIWMDFLERSGPWDVVHFNTENPLEIIELTKKTGARIRYSFHNFYLLFPLEQLFSNRKFNEDPYRDLTVYDYTGESAVSEYEAMGTLPRLSGPRRAELVRQFDERIRYGWYLLSDVIDEVLGASTPHIIYIREVFKAAFPNMILTDFALTKNGSSPTESAFIKSFYKRYLKVRYSIAKFRRKYQAHSKVIFGVYANVNRYKGHHIIARAVEALEDCKGQFEVRFYGHTDFDAEYVEMLSKQIEESAFLKDHVKMMGGYKLEEMPRITEDTLVSIGCSATSLGSSGGIYEALEEGNLPVFVMDYSFIRELKMVERFNDPCDLEPNRLHYPCGDPEALAGLMRRIIRKEIDLEEWFQKSMELMLMGRTLANNFKKVWNV